MGFLAITSQGLASSCLRDQACRKARELRTESQSLHTLRSPTSSSAGRHARMPHSNPSSSRGSLIFDRPLLLLLLLFVLFLSFSQHNILLLLLGGGSGTSVSWTPIELDPDDPSDVFEVGAYYLLVLNPVTGFHFILPPPLKHTPHLQSWAPLFFLRISLQALPHQHYRVFLQTSFYDHLLPPKDAMTMLLCWHAAFLGRYAVTAAAKHMIIPNGYAAKRCGLQGHALRHLSFGSASHSQRVAQIYLPHGSWIHSPHPRQPATGWSCTIALCRNHCIQLYVLFRHDRERQAFWSGCIRRAWPHGCKVCKRVTVISTSPNKKKEAIENLGADNFLISSDKDAMKKASKSIDYIIDTVSAPHELNPLQDLLTVNGKLAHVGISPKPFELQAGNLIFGRRFAGGSLIGSIQETQEMLDFGVENNITSTIEKITVFMSAICKL